MAKPVELLVVVQEVMSTALPRAGDLSTVRDDSTTPNRQACLPQHAWRSPWRRVRRDRVDRDERAAETAVVAAAAVVVAVAVIAGWSANARARVSRSRASGAAHRRRRLLPTLKLDKQLSTRCWVAAVAGLEPAVAAAAAADDASSTLMRLIRAAA